MSREDNLMEEDLTKLYYTYYSRWVMELWLWLHSEQTTGDKAKCSQVELHLPRLLPVSPDYSHDCSQVMHSQAGHWAWNCPGK